MPMRRIRLGDMMVILAVLVTAGVLFAFSFLPKEAGTYLSVTSDAGEARYTLFENRTLTVNSGGHTLSVVIDNQKAYVASSDCPDGSCLHQGKISSVGETVICVPSGVVLKVLGEGSHEDDNDIVAG